MLQRSPKQDSNSSTSDGASIRLKFEAPVNREFVGKYFYLSNDEEFCQVGTKSNSVRNSLSSYQGLYQKG